MNPLLGLLPIGFVCWFLPFPFAATASRTLLLISVSGGLTRIRLLRPLEAHWILLSLLFLAPSATSAAFSMDVSASLIDFGRQAYIVVFSILLMLATRDASAREQLASAMIIPGVLGMAAVLLLYWKFGWGISDEALRAFKGSVSASSPTLSMNPLAACLVLACFLLIPAISRFKQLILIVAATLSLVLVLTGARSTLLALPAALSLFWMFRFFSNRATFARLCGIVLVLALCFRAVGNIRISANAVDELDSITTHRVYLWEAAFEQFVGHPWLGAGADTWRLDLGAPAIPAQSREMSDRLSQLSSGAYHNAYLTFLAERGLIVFIPAVLILRFVLRCAFRAYEYRQLFAPGCRELATVAPVIVLFIMVRQLAEASGLLGYANGMVDFASFAVASLIIALAGDIRHVVYTTRQPQHAMSRVTSVVD